MISTAFFTIPLQMVCQLVIPGANITGNAGNPVINTRSFTEPTVLPEGYTAFPETGVAYKYVTSVITWDDARKYCIAEGAALAETDTVQKVTNARSVATKADNPWVGLHRLFNVEQWTGARTGQQLMGLPWARGTDSQLGERDFKCGSLWMDHTNLFAANCNDKRRFICEIPIPAV